MTIEVFVVNRPGCYPNYEVDPISVILDDLTFLGSILQHS